MRTWSCPRLFLWFERHLICDASLTSAEIKINPQLIKIIWGETLGKKKIKELHRQLALQDKKIWGSFDIV